VKPGEVIDIDHEIPIEKLTLEQWEILEALNNDSEYEELEEEFNIDIDIDLDMKENNK
jgi:hypothetical protein